jgi:hypothetical protein
MTPSTRTVMKWLAVAAGAAAGTYGALVATAWWRYGHPAPPTAEEADDLLHQFVPSYDIVERHHVRVAAPAAVTLEAAREADLQASPVVAAIIKAREMILGATPDRRERPTGLLAEVQALGWRVLVHVPDREIVVGAVTRPWEPNVTFRPIPPEDFPAFNEPGYVKIAWTLRADPVDRTSSIFRTETRAVATDVAARAAFRRYWAFVSPGIVTIRWALLGPVKREAERRAREQSAAVR